MCKLNIFAFILLTPLLYSSCSGDQSEKTSKTYQILKTGFQSPPDYARPKAYWWWINGYSDTTRMEEELQALHQAGIRGVDIFEIGAASYSNPDKMIPAGPAFMGQKSLKDITAAIKIAGKLGMEVGLNLASSWNAGGSWVPPEHAAKSLYFSKTMLEGPGNERVNLPFPEIFAEGEINEAQKVLVDKNGNPKYSREVAVVAYPEDISGKFPDTSNIHVLNEKFDPEKGVLEWRVPEGKWEIYRYVCSNSGEPLKLPSPNSTGLIIDHFDDRATAFHFNYFINKLDSAMGDLSQTALEYFYLASYEATGFVWTPTLPSAFEKQNGYQLYKFLPVLHREEKFSGEMAKGFQYDYRKTLSQLMINNHYKKGKSIANEHGIELISESGGPGPPLHNVPVEALGALGALDVPRGEFWYKHARYNEDSIDLLRMVKGPAAAGHIYQRSPVEMEAFTTFRHWQNGPFDLKRVGDRAFAEGMTRPVVHGSTHNPAGTGYPGIVYHAGTHYNDKRVWWPKIRPFNDYLARNAFMAQEGKFMADVLYYHGDHAPNVVRPKNADFSVAPGYDYEVVNTEILLEKVVFEDDLIKIPGVGSYRMMVLEESETINPEVLEKLGQLAGQGAIIIGQQPSRKAGLGFREWDEESMQQAIDQNWQSISGQSLSDELLAGGKILEGTTAKEVLEFQGVNPDFNYPGLASENYGPGRWPVLDYIHYQKEEMDYYLVRNTTEKWVTKKCLFRQNEMVPERWDPVTGEMVELPVHQQSGDQTGIPLTFAPYEACFVVFRNGEATPRWEEIIPGTDQLPSFDYHSGSMVIREKSNFTLQKAGESREMGSEIQNYQLTGSWEVTFPEGWVAPAQTTFPELISWTEAEETGIRYFSGIVTYQKSFEVPLDTDKIVNDQRIYLSLGELEKVGEIWLNGQNLGITWAKPHEYDITDVLKSGENVLKVEIANVWANRIIGDACTGEDFTNTNITRVEGVPWKDVSLVPSGLLGPVEIEVRRLVPIN